MIADGTCLTGVCSTFRASATSPADFQALEIIPSFRRQKLEEKWVRE
jgi:hypothetical protein